MLIRKRDKNIIVEFNEDQDGNIWGKTEKWVWYSIGKLRITKKKLEKSWSW